MATNVRESLIDYTRLIRRAGEEGRRRICSKDCYGRVHTDIFLVWRLRSEPAVREANDARALLVAREFLAQEGLGAATIRAVRPVSISRMGVASYRGLVKAWLEAHPQFETTQLVAQAIKVQYVRFSH